MASSPITSQQTDGEGVEAVTDSSFLGFQSHCDQWLQPVTLAPWKESYDKPRQHIKKQKHPFANKGLSSQSYGFSCSYLQIRELDHKEGWTPKWCFWIVVLEKNLESPLDCREIKLVSPKVNQPWILIRSPDAEIEAPVVRSPDVKRQLIGKHSHAGKDWRHKEKGVAEDEMVDDITNSADMNLNKLWEIVWFYDDLQDLLELTPKKDVLFIIEDWNAKVGPQEIPGVTGMFGLGVQNEAGQRLTVLPRERSSHTNNTSADSTHGHH